MTLLKSFIGFIGCIVVFISCKKELSNEVKDPAAIVDAKWEFTEADVVHMGNVDSVIYSAQTDLSLLTIEGASTDDKKGAIVLYIADDSFAVGTYNSPYVYFQYLENGTTVYETVQDDPNVSNFSVTITALDSSSITGTFQGKVYDLQGNEHIITNGKFTSELGGPLKPGTPLPNNPDPDPDPEPNPDLDYLPLASEWIYASLDDPNDIVNITSQGTVDFDGKEYTKFVNDATGETRYFRKDTTAGIYYERVNPSEGFPLTEPIELIILQEKEDPNFKWQSDEFVIDYSSVGVPFTMAAKLESRITVYNGTFDINGKTYKNVIEVTTELISKNPDTGEWEPPVSWAITRYAKGIGIVQYQDLSTLAEYGIKDYTIVP